MTHPMGCRGTTTHQRALPSTNGSVALPWHLSPMVGIRVCVWRYPLEPAQLSVGKALGMYAAQHRSRNGSGPREIRALRLRVGVRRARRARSPISIIFSYVVPPHTLSRPPCNLPSHGESRNLSCSQHLQLNVCPRARLRTGLRADLHLWCFSWRWRIARRHVALASDQARVRDTPSAVTTLCSTLRSSSARRRGRRRAAGGNRPSPLRRGA